MHELIISAYVSCCDPAQEVAQKAIIARLSPMCKCVLFSNQGKSLESKYPETLFSPLYKWKHERCIPIGINAGDRLNAGGITTRNPFFLLTFPGSVTYLKLMKPKDLGELCAAISDLANQTGIEKTDLLIIHKPNLTSSHLKKHINGPWKPEARNRTRPSFYARPGYQQF